MTTPSPMRCAIYTRKSSEEGLEQRFNSLHAQRQACEAYVRSQQGEGWRLLRQRYDDGGFSGAKLDRPGLQRLLEDVRAGQVDVVLVYKVDRLTRSLADFARIIEVLEKAGASFVSVTQAFNSTSSMGRLTLNVLLSFAQFEREITGERIRDKIAASKAKGLWMGGMPPLGYDPPAVASRRILQVNEGEAETVRLIFQRFLESGSVHRLQCRLDAEGVRSKRYRTRGGRNMGGCHFSRGALTHLLGNRVYVGDIVHRGVAHRGQHTPILDRVTFDAAQALLEAGSRKRRTHVPIRAGALLDRILFDADGQPMVFRIYGKLRGLRHAYYISPPIPGTDNVQSIRRVTASAIEGLLRAKVAALTDVPEEDLERRLLRDIVARVEIHPSDVRLLLRLNPLCRNGAGLEDLRRRLPPDERLQRDSLDQRLARLELPLRIKLRGGRTWHVGPKGSELKMPDPPDLKLAERIQKAHRILACCDAAPDASRSTLFRAKAPTTTAATRAARWAFLAPDLQHRILTGHAPAGGPWPGELELPLLWSEQRALFDRQPQSILCRPTSMASVSEEGVSDARAN